MSKRVASYELDVLPPAKIKTMKTTYCGSSVPLDGWIHPCNQCNMWTGATFKLTEGIEIPMCRTCSYRVFQ